MFLIKSSQASQDQESIRLFTCEMLVDAHQLSLHLWCSSAAVTVQQLFSAETQSRFFSSLQDQWPLMFDPWLRCFALTWWDFAILRVVNSICGFSRDANSKGLLRKRFLDTHQPVSQHILNISKGMEMHSVRDTDFVFFFIWPTCRNTPETSFTCPL